MPELTRSMFGITGMNVVKVEKNAPLLEIGLSAVKTAAIRPQPTEERTVALCCTEGP